MAASKKWKYTVRIQHDGRPIGTWLEIHGYAPKTLTYVSCAKETFAAEVANDACAKRMLHAYTAWK